MPQLVPNAQRTLQVFEVFAREKKPLSNSELARFLELADSSCSDLLFTLREAGYLLRTPRSRFFYPTQRLHDVSARIAATDPLTAFANEALEFLSKRSSETSMLGYLNDTQAKIFACQESSRALRYVLPPGTVVELHATAIGKAILGALPSAERNALIDRLPMKAVTKRSIQDREVLRREIAKGAKRHWSLARDEGSEGVTALGIAGVVDGRLIGLSIVGPSHRLEKNVDNYVAILLEAREEFF